MRISVRRSGNAISETARDLQAANVTIRTEGPAIVHRNGETLNRVTRAISRSKAGPHGQNFAERIHATMIGDMAVEVGPSPLLGTRYVGVDGSAGVERDLTEALAKVLPGFQKDAANLMDRLL
ncbi:MAG TPA: hypothetical protein VIP28_11110 [Nocardioides sp.]